MESVEYEKLSEYEASYWWYRGLQAILVDTVGRLRLGPLVRIFDAGCGTGKNLDVLVKDVSGAAFGCELSGHAAKYWSHNGIVRYCLASVNSIPFVDGAFDVVVTVDVLCCQEVEEAAALHELWRVVRKGGYLIIVVPAYQWLLSEHDRAVHSVRRYTIRRLARLLEQPSARVVRTTYLFPSLFPFIASYRSVRNWIAGGNGRNPPRSDLHRLPSVLNALLYGIALVEGRLLRMMNFPFGSSVLMVVKKVS